MSGTATAGGLRGIGGWGAAADDLSVGAVEREERWNRSDRRKRALRVSSTCEDNSWRRWRCGSLKAPKMKIG